MRPVATREAQGDLLGRFEPARRSEGLSGALYSVSKLREVPLSVVRTRAAPKSDQSREHAPAGERGLGGQSSHRIASAHLVSDVRYRVQSRPHAPMCCLYPPTQPPTR